MLTALGVIFELHSNLPGGVQGAEISSQPYCPGGDEGHLVGAAAGGSLWGNHLTYSFRASQKVEMEEVYEPCDGKFCVT